MQHSKRGILETEAAAVGSGQGRKGKRKQREDEPVLTSIKVTALSHGIMDYDHMAYSLKVQQSIVSPSTGAEVAASARVVSKVRPSLVYVKPLHCHPYTLVRY